ncbi:MULTISPECIES: ATP synthase F1 subunit delta [Mangrovimonas]|uniref:ATP synthase F1 subunit delta n=1 Tax=Mangrovimonas TaxID=1211036 RepID=UPI0006B56444|nr:MULTISPECIES: ATP synthase F1 subunit delta [Mangrovimonas]OMP32180.1 ATP synthase F1 subunit delta [Mangrovimonas sp. DI 80]WMI68896.1 ATP synthase F1 subunit delta [Mangrovimonas sp. YM274]
MAGERAAVRYAKAALSLASDNNNADAVNNDMKLIATTIAGSKDLSEMLLSPVVRSSVKRAVLSEVFKNTNAITTNLIETLITNKRIALLEVVANKYTHLFDVLKGIQVAKVTTAVPLTDALKAQVLAKVKELTGGTEVEVQNIIDEDIIGGFILRVGDMQYNASIANNLNKLKREFTLN